MFEVSKLRKRLYDLKTILPGDHPCPTINEKFDEMRFETFDEFMVHYEHGLALDALIYIAECHIDFGNTINKKFWLSAKEIAEKMEMGDAVSTCATKLKSL